MGLEDRVLEPNRNGAHYAFAHVVAFEFLARVFIDRLEQALAEGAQVRAAVGGVLAVDEGIERFAVAAVGVRETKLQRLLRVMERRINRLAAVRLQIFHDQIEQAIARLEGLPIVHQLKARLAGHRIQRLF